MLRTNTAITANTDRQRRAIKTRMLVEILRDVYDIPMDHRFTINYDDDVVYDFSRHMYIIIAEDELWLNDLVESFHVSTVWNGNSWSAFATLCKRHANQLQEVITVDNVHRGDAIVELFIKAHTDDVKLEYTPICVISPETV